MRCGLASVLVLALVFGVAAPAGSSPDSAVFQLALQEGSDDTESDQFASKPLSEGTRNEPEAVPSGRKRSGLVGEREHTVDTDSVVPFGSILPGGGSLAEIPISDDRAVLEGSPLSVLVNPVLRGAGASKVRVESPDLPAPTGVLSDLFSVELLDGQSRFMPGSDRIVVEVDYSGYASELNAGLASRLTLARFEGCTAEEIVVDSQSASTETVTVCDSVTPLTAEHDLVARVFSVDLAAQRVEPELVLSLENMVLQSGSGGWLGIVSGSGYGGGTFSATPLANVADYQVSTFAGSFDTSFPIPVPPAPAGATPGVSLGYSSGGIDSMRSDKNNQAGDIGLGWSLGAGGSITRHFHPYDCGITTGDLCMLADEFTLTLNGVSSRLVETSTNNEFRLEADPMWKIELKSNGSQTFESHGQWWKVTTPDGTMFEFGRTDDALDHVPVYTGSGNPGNCSGHEESGWASNVCYKAWRWNLNQSEDTRGNLVAYSYLQEVDHVDVRGDTADQGEVVRASHLSEILYTDNGAEMNPKSRVRFLYELRCDNPDVKGQCNGAADFADTPVDLACRAADGACNRSYPVFFTELRLAGIQTQTIAEGSGDWRTVGWWDFDQSYPTNHNTNPSEEHPSEPKMWLDSITQRPGSDLDDPGSWTAYSHLRFVDADTKSGVSSDIVVSDFGGGLAVGGTHEDDYVVFENVDFGGSAPAELLVRYAADGSSGDIEFWIDAIGTGAGGDKIANIDVTSTGGYQDWQYETDTTIDTDATGVHDLYIVFKNVSGTKLANLSFFRFKPSSGSLDGLNPTIFEAAEDGDGYYHRNRAEDLSNIYSVGRDPMRMPRLGKITNPLGGQVDVTYFQEHPWDSSGCEISIWKTGPNCDYYAGWYDEFRIAFSKWKVEEVETYDAFSQNITRVDEYSYSRPKWRWSEIPGYEDQDCGVPCNTYSDFRGHETVTVTTKSPAGNTLGETEYVFFQGMDGNPLWDEQNPTLENEISRADRDVRDDDWLAGRVTQVTSRNGGAWETREITDYEVIETITEKARFVAPEEIVTSTNASPDRTSKVKYEYHQTYGSVTGEIHYGDDDISGDNRYVDRAFVRNSTKWIINTPKYERVWSGTSVGGTELAYTKFYYETGSGSIVYGESPNHPEATRVRGFAGSGSTGAADTDTDYDSYGRPKTVTDGNGNDTSFSYDSSHGYLNATTVENVTRHNLVGGTPTNDHVTSIETYDPGYGIVLEVDDPNENTTHVETDLYGRVTKVWYPTETFPTGTPSVEYQYVEHDPNSGANGSPARVRTKTLHKGATNTWKQFDYYDGFGRVIQTQTDAPDTGERFLQSRYYNAAGQVRRQSQPRLDTTADAGAGYQVEDWSGSNMTVELQEIYTYDDLSRLTLTETVADDDPNNALFTTETAYDGWDTTHTNKNDVDTDYFYDWLGNLVQIKEHNNTSIYTTSYDYDRMGRLTKVTDNAGNTTEVEYDLLGRKTRLVDPNMLDTGSEPEWSYTYDDNGNVVSQEDPRGTVIDFSYDELNRVYAKEVVKDQGSTVSFELARWVFDDTGQLGLLDKTEAYHDSGNDYNSVDITVTVHNISYDDRDRVTETKWSIDDGSTTNYTFEYSYDPADRVETILYPTVGGGEEELSYTYDSRTGQPTDLDTDLAGADSVLVHNAEWTATGQPVSYQLGDTNGEIVYRSWTYKDGSQRLARIKAGTTTGGGDISHFRHFYDPVGNIVRLNDENHSQLQCFSYDDLNRLEDAFTSDDCDNGYNPNTGTGAYEHWYEYNSIGNLKKLRDTENGSLLADWDYGDTTVGAGAYAAHSYDPSPGAAVAIEYDNTGNMTEWGSDTLEWDADNQLRKYDKSTGTDTEFVYDADGNRILRIHGGTTTTYITDLYETDGTTTHLYYTFAGETIGYREHASGTSTRFYLTGDHLGSTATVVEVENGALGTPVDQYYYPFGEPRTTWSIDIDRGYTGQTADTEETGLYHYNARYYHPTLRRFISADTIIPNPANPQTLNRYSYVVNSPPNYTDPSGNVIFRNIGTGGVGGAHDSPTTGTTGGAGNSPGGLVRADQAAGFVVQAAKLLLFDPAGCQQVRSVSCGAELLGILPFGKLARFARVFKYGDETADIAQVATKRADDVVGAVCSFSADTGVVMADGTTKPISEVEVGDWVFAHDPETGEQGARQVTHVWEHQDTLYDLETSAGTITTTEDHPYWNHTDQEWQPAESLDPGDQLLASNGKDITFVGLERSSATTGDAYNLTISHVPTYHVAVGDNTVLVHNTCPTGLAGSSRGLSDLFASGTVRNRSIVEIRASLISNGFTQSLSKNKSGYLFRNRLGEQIRIMSRNNRWEIRIMNQHGNYLDEFGNVASPAATHGIGVVSR